MPLIIAPMCRKFDASKTHASLFGGCVACFLHSLNSTGVYLMSDSPVSYQQLKAALPEHITLSSPLASDARVVHIDKLDRARESASDTRHLLLKLFAEWILFSAVDAVVLSKSGLSESAALWGDIPAANIRQLPRLPSGTQRTSCEPATYLPHYYSVALSC